MNFLFSDNVLAPKKGSLIAGYLYWPVYLFVIGWLVSLIMGLCGKDSSTAEGLTFLNIIYSTVNFIVVLLIFHRFLFDSLRAIRWNGMRIFTSVLLGYALASVLAFQLNFVYMLFDLVPDNLNQETVTDILDRAPWRMGICAVIFAPVVEECMVRGLIFGTLAKKVPALGYILSIVVFAGIHVVNSIGISDWQNILLSFCEYLPHSIALAWAYHRSGNIFAPILLHSSMNLMSVLAQLSGLV